MNMEDIWERIKQTTTNYLVNGVPEPDQALLFDAFPGAGKTRNTLDMLMEIGHPFIYLAPNHEVIVENLTFHERDYIGGFVHFMGRKHLCHFEERRRMAQSPKNGGYNMPIKPFCSSCVMRDNGCEYYQRRWEIESTNPPSWAGVHSHVTSYLHDYLFGDEEHDPRFNDFDVLVLEENPITSLMVRTDLTRQDLIILEEEIGNFPFSNEEQLEVFSGIIDYFFTRLGRDIEYQRLWRKAIQWRYFEWKEFKEAFDSYIVLRITDMDNPLRRPPKDIVYLLDDIFKNVTRDVLPYNITSEYGNKENEPAITLNYFYGEALQHLPIQVIGLDGTANEAVWSRILSKEMHTIKISHIFENVYQLHKFKYPQASWIYRGMLRKTGESLLKLAELIIRSRKGKVLLIGSKKLQKPVMEKLKEIGLEHRVEYAWYYNLRSKNYLHCDTVVLLMRPSPPLTQLEIYTNLSGWEAEIWESYYTIDEMLQALARIRPHLKEVVDGFGRRRIRDKTEMFVFSGEEIFREGDIKEGSYYVVNIPTMKYFLLTGISTPLNVTRGDLEVRDGILDILKNGDELTAREINSTINKPKIVKRMLDRMRVIGEIYYRGTKYGIAR